MFGPENRQRLLVVMTGETGIGAFTRIRVGVISLLRSGKPGNKKYREERNHCAPSRDLHVWQVRHYVN